MPAMLTDALKAETYRLWRDRGAVFWGFAFPGIGVFLLGIVASLFIRFVAKQQMPGAINLGSDTIGALGGAGSPITQIFFLIAAAAIFGTDYRWETWRLQTPRNSRINLMLAKFAAYGLGVFLALLGMAVGGLLSGLVRAVIETSPIAPFDFATWQAGFLRGLVASWLELMVVGVITALLAVLTRTNVAAIIVTLLLAFAQAIIMGQVRIDPRDPPLDALASFPALAANVVRGGPVDIGGATANGAPAAALMLGLWIVVFGGAAILLFLRQELTRE